MKNRMKVQEAGSLLLRAWLAGLLALFAPAALAQTPASPAEVPACQVSAALEAQINEGETALHRIFLGTGDEAAKLRAAVQDAYAVLVFPHVAKVGFFVTAAQGKGMLSYREADGNWSYPILVTARVRSIGPHFSLQTIDMMIVAATHEALVDLLTGTAPARPGAGPNAQIVTYSSNRGLTMGVSLDEYQITLDQESNQGLYCKPIQVGDIVRKGHGMTLKPSPCIQKFAQTMNRAAGRAPITRRY